MACLRPVQIWRADLRDCSPEYFREVTGWTKKTMPADIREQYSMNVACGKCEQCLQRKKNDYYVRCVKEYEYCTNIGGVVLFATLTFDDAHIPLWQGRFSFDKRIIQAWLTKMQVYVRRYWQCALKYFVVSELGGLTHRPHHHAILYLYPLDDNGNVQKRFNMSNMISRDAIFYDLCNWFDSNWTFGISEIKPVTSAGAIQYVSKYTGKDVCNDILFTSWRNLNECLVKGFMKRYYDMVGSASYEDIDRFAERVERCKYMLVLIRRIHHRYSQFTMISQGIGVSLENELCKKDLAENLPIWVTGFPYAIPRYYVDRYNRYYLKLHKEDCDKLGECPDVTWLTDYNTINSDYIEPCLPIPANLFAFKLSSERARLARVNASENLKRLLYNMDASCRQMYYDSLPDEELSIENSLRLARVCKRAYDSRVSARRDAMKLKYEKDKVAQKLTLAQRAGYHVKSDAEIREDWKRVVESRFLSL